MIAVETHAGPEWGSGTDWTELAEDAVAAAIAESRHSWLVDSGAGCELSVKLASDEEVRRLNAAYRGKDKTTNVLSFPMIEADDIDSAGRGDGPTLLGDIAVAHGVCAEEAAAHDIGLAAHAAHLIIHGALHLIGYDHENDAAAEEMERVEIAALARLGIAHPYFATEV
ncbi:MAG: rRNA maturation RNase YbeY [Sphingomonadaceae bacterium]